MALMVTGPNQRILGGISAPSTNISSAFQAGQQANLQRQDTKQIMRSREQQMALNLEAEKRAKAQEARAQAAFEAQQAARAQAAARAAQERAAMSTLMQGLSGVGGTPTAGVSGAAPVAPVATSRAGLALPTSPSAPTPAPTAGVPLSMDMTPTGPAGGVQVASSDPQEAFRAAFQARPDLFGGGGEFPTGGAGTDTVAPQRMFMTPESTAVRAGLAQAVSLPPVGGYGSTTARDMQIADTQRKIDTLNAQIQSITAALRAPGSQADPGATSRVIQQLAAERDALQASMPISNAPAIPRDVFSEEGSGVAGLPPLAAEAPTTAEEAAEPPTPPERTGQDPFIVEQDTPTGPVAGLSPAGATNPVAATEAAAAAAPDGNASAYLISNPNLVLDLQEQLARERQALEARLQYAQATGNRALFDQTFDALNSRERVVNENMITGQIAILAAQQDNFGPLQEFVQRANPNDDIQVIPYTNGTVAFFKNGQEDGEPVRTTDLLKGLAQTFNSEYREALAAAAETAAKRDQFLFENMVLQQLQTAREISVAQAKALSEIEAKYGEVTYVADLQSGDKLFQTLVPNRGYVQFRVVEAGQPLLNGQPAVSATVEEIPPGTLR